MDALEEDACAVVTAPAFTAECPNATRPSVRVDGEPMAGMGQVRRATSMGTKVGLMPLELPSVNYRAAGRG